MDRRTFLLGVSSAAVLAAVPALGAASDEWTVQHVRTKLNFDWTPKRVLWIDGDVAFEDSIDNLVEPATP